MFLCSFTISKTFQKKLTRSQPCFNNSGTLSAYSHVLLQLFLFFRASRSFAKTGSFFSVFSSLFFVSVFGLVLGAFWVPFWLLFGLFFWVFSLRFFNHIPGRFWVPFWVHFGTVLASKIDLGDSRGRKGGSSKTSVLLKENHTFWAWTSPGGSQNRSQKRFQKQWFFQAVLGLKTVPKWVQNGSKMESESS